MYLVLGLLLGFWNILSAHFIRHTSVMRKQSTPSFNSIFLLTRAATALRYCDELIPSTLNKQNQCCEEWAKMSSDFSHPIVLWWWWVSEHMLFEAIRWIFLIMDNTQPSSLSLLAHFFLVMGVSMVLLFHGTDSTSSASILAVNIAYIPNSFLKALCQKIYIFQMLKISHLGVKIYHFIPFGSLKIWYWIIEIVKKKKREREIKSRKIKRSCFIKQFCIIFRIPPYLLGFLQSGFC